MTLEICPNCGADVPRNAKACPECGSDENSGWSILPARAVSVCRTRNLITTNS
jgi:NMD protein affecting ribosome stability and mRNA decay